MKALPSDSPHTSPVRVGHVSGAHGLRGQLRVKLDNPDSELLEVAGRLILVTGSEERCYEVTGAQRANRTMLRLTLAGITSVEQAESLRGAIVMVARTNLPTTAPGEFYYFQAIGCDVLTTDGRRLGTVQEVFPTGANDVLVVRDGGKEILIPAIEDVVKSIDLAAQRITVEPVPGLLD